MDRFIFGDYTIVLINALYVNERTIRIPFKEPLLKLRIEKYGMEKTWTDFMKDGGDVQCKVKSADKCAEVLFLMPTDFNLHWKGMDKSLMIEQV